MVQETCDKTRTMNSSWNRNHFTYVIVFQLAQQISDAALKEAGIKLNEEK